ncbi:MAG: FAD-dependent thymidylate synthase [Candidatus Sumerlaeaceae bacterium]|nr:FAD-dependent thymidylate synthase [Candidatus Sumerlaeaceae bacterium]
MTEPYVKLVNIFSSAYDNFIATARTCYSAKGIVDVETVTGPRDAEPTEIEKRRARKTSLAQSLFKAGHHTTLQHAHVQFALDRVSRHFIWSFLHSHPFYNSEQVSQRYVTVRDGNFHVPPTLEGRSREIYLACLQRQMADYQELSELLRPLVAAEYFGRFNGRHGSKRAETDIQKRAQEAARYVLPVATYAYLYHTISVITLLRYHRVAQEFDTSEEQRRVVGAMVDALLAHEPEFATILQQPMAIEETPEYAFFANREFTEVDMENAERIVGEFDAELNGATSRLVDWGARNEEVLAASVREVLGVSRDALSDADAIEFVMNPSRNRLLGEPMNLGTLSKLSRTLFHPRYVFRKKLSHAADSQDQRHRLTPGSRPILMRHYTGRPDFVTPEIIRRDDNAARRYNESMEATWDTINQLLRAGESPEDAAYLLPNAVNIRFTESGDLLNLHHKMAMRLCYNAQEEIWRASLEESLAIASENPNIGRWLLPPCSLRKHAGVKPICPEGDRYCGIPVWRLQLQEYERVI